MCALKANLSRNQVFHLLAELCAALPVTPMLSLAAIWAMLPFADRCRGCPTFAPTPVEAPARTPFEALVPPAVAAAPAVVMVLCLRFALAASLTGDPCMGFVGAEVCVLFRTAVCGVPKTPLARSLAGVIAAGALSEATVLLLTGDGIVDPLPAGTAAVLRSFAALRASSGMAERWLKGEFVMKGCVTASEAFNLRSGSQRRHRVMKSMNASSSVLIACCKVFELGRRRLPLLDTVTLGLPTESKNSFLRVHFSTKCRSGGPKISMIHASCSCSFSPGKMG